MDKDGKQNGSLNPASISKITDENIEKTGNSGGAVSFAETENKNSAPKNGNGNKIKESENGINTANTKPLKNGNIQKANVYGNTEVDIACMKKKSDAGRQNYEKQKAARAVEARNRTDKSSRRKASLWSIKITAVTFVLAIFFSFLSELTSSTGNITVTVLLLVFLILGNIVFDGIGVAATACELPPLVSMSARKVYGARIAVNLVKNAEKVSNICSDVIGDIFGIISGACSVVIIMKILTLFDNPNQRLLTIGLSSIVAAVTVGGKALIKEIAIKNSKELIMFVARIAAVFSKEERKNKKKNKQLTEKK